MSPPVSSRSAPALLLTLLLAASAAAAERPVRWTRGAAVWSTPQQALEEFLRSGAVRDRGLQGGLERAGWSAAEIRAALNKLYSVDPAAVDRFLRSPAGEALLAARARTYHPYRSQGATGVEALRAAILADAADGSISSAGILANLPTDMRLSPGCPAEARPCPPLLSWWVFLPARLQAGQSLSAVIAPAAPSAAGAPAAAAGPAPPGR